MNYDNYMKLSISAISRNEAFARSVVGAFCTQLNPTLEQVDDIKTAVSEAVTNCIVHAYRGKQEGTIDIFCGIKGSSIEIEITDYGKGIDDVEQAMQPFFTTVATGERSGMGFTVMKAFCDDVCVVSSNGKTTVKLTKSFDGKAD
ncbi:MAG: anti-sigma F factor [Corallococcus sp.]|nr:anti-sigma F factor [Corallococcus sp.]